MPGPEGLILRMGLLTAAGFLIWLAALYLWSAEQAAGYTGMVISHLVAGRAAGMTFGFAYGFGYLPVMLCNATLETILVLIFYPLIVASYRHLEVFPSLKGAINRIREAAEKRQDIVRRFGIPGLFVFVCFPLWMTGPVVGSLIGYLIGLKPFWNMLVVLVGTHLATIGWAVLLKQVHDESLSLGAYGPLILAALLIGLAIFLALRRRRRHT